MQSSRRKMFLMPKKCRSKCKMQALIVYTFLQYDFLYLLMIKWYIACNVEYTLFLNLYVQSNNHRLRIINLYDPIANKVNQKGVRGVYVTSGDLL